MARKATRFIRVPENLHQSLAALTGVEKILPRSEGKQEDRPKEKIGKTVVRFGNKRKEDAIRKLKGF